MECIAHKYIKFILRILTDDLSKGILVRIIDNKFIISNHNVILTTKYTEY